MLTTALYGGYSLRAVIVAPTLPVAPKHQLNDTTTPMLAEQYPRGDTFLALSATKCVTSLYDQIFDVIVLELVEVYLKT